MRAYPLGPFARRCGCGALVETEQHSRCQKCRARARYYRQFRRPARRGWRGQRRETGRP
jgi:hypothetical protein